MFTDRLFHVSSYISFQAVLSLFSKVSFRLANEEKNKQITIMPRTLFTLALDRKPSKTLFKEIQKDETELHGPRFLVLIEFEQC